MRSLPVYLLGIVSFCHPERGEGPFFPAAVKAPRYARGDSYACGPRTSLPGNAPVASPSR